MNRLVFAWGNTYEVEQCGDMEAIYRRIPPDEYVQWYMWDDRVEHCGEIRRLYLMSVPSGKAEEMFMNMGKEGSICRNTSMKKPSR